jgi:site-specific DNA recombinase
LTISRQEVEERILRALREKLIREDLFEGFCREYTREINRLRMTQRSGLSRARQELTRVEREIRQIVQAIKDGISALTIKDELLSLEAQQLELRRRLQAPEPQPLLHPSMADLYRTKVTSLCAALEQGDPIRTEAHEPIRGLLPTTSWTKYSWLQGRATTIICSSGDWQHDHIASSKSDAACAGSSRQRAALIHP